MDRQRRRIQRECDILNRERNVIETNRYAFNDFFSAAGNSIITFGFAQDRYDALKSLISQASKKIVILNGDPQLENILVNYFSEGNHGTFVRYSKHSPKFNVFYNMTNQQIVDYIRDVAKHSGYFNVDVVTQYATAFLTILSQYVKHPSLSSMMDMLSHSDGEIIGFGRHQDVGEDVINKISVNAAAGHSFRDIINSIYGAFANITTERCQGHFNLLNSRRLERHDVTLINIDSYNPYIINHYFEKELRLSQTDYHLIINEVNLNEEDGLLRAIEDRSRIRKVTLISGNVLTMVGSTDHLHNFPSQILFTANFSQTDGLDLLQQYGSYQYHFPSRVLMHRPTLFDPIPGTQTQIGAEERLRVRLVDLNGFIACLSHGLNQNIILTRRLI
ncbi:MAG: hypothetical protein J6P61_03520 [Erysipelotrichaceae bacterium]|nr:hypothetical protein [Erysipelotrichaceae bacterium]